MSMQAPKKSRKGAGASESEQLVNQTEPQEYAEINPKALQQVTVKDQPQKQLKKDTREELKIVQRSLKRTTSPDCPYEVSDKTAKRIIRVKERCNLVQRIVGAVR